MDQLVEPDKFQLPGWKIEKKYNDKILLGNWSEERRSFTRGDIPFGDSTNRRDFKHHQGFLPNAKIRREASLRNEGLPSKHFFAHHGDRYANNLVSLYDQHINQRDVKESKLPKLRKWDPKSSSFTPEKSDFPLQGTTNFGLVERRRSEWSRNDSSDTNFRTTYNLSYNLHPSCSFTFEHFAPPKVLSSHFNVHNNVNKNLPFRNVQVNLAPEFQPEFQG